MKNSTVNDGISPKKAAVRDIRSTLFSVGIFTAAINVLTLTGSFFMLQIYDRVIPSRSMPTLVGLSIIVVVLYGFYGFFEGIRSRILVRVGRTLDSHFNRIAYGAVIKSPLLVGEKTNGLQPVRDLDQVRSFLSSAGPGALLDLPWIPFYLVLCFAFHVWIGVAALIGAFLLISLTIATEVLTKRSVTAASEAGATRFTFLESFRRNAHALHAMGMIERTFARWNAVNTAYMDNHQRSADVAATFGAASRISRMLLQSAVMAVGAYLVIEQQATAGIIIASSILTSRAMAPVELTIAHWKNFVASRQSWKRLSASVDRILVPEPMPLPLPTRDLSVEGVSIIPPGSKRLVVRDATFNLKAGDGLGIVGPSASGKSSLIRSLVGIWMPVQGKVRLDGATLDQWSPEVLGAGIGYVPQEIEMFDGTVAENIARFEKGFDPENVIAAATLCDVHDLILRLPDGYETKIGEGGTVLSAGQRQRLALARALYKDPFLLVLDEPNSNLDADGEHALSRAITAVRARGGIVVVVAHRPSTLESVDLLLVMGNGQIQKFGPKQDILAKPRTPTPSTAPRPAKGYSITTNVGQPV